MPFAITSSGCGSWFEMPQTNWLWNRGYTPNMCLCFGFVIYAWDMHRAELPLGLRMCGSRLRTWNHSIDARKLDRVWLLLPEGGHPKVPKANAQGCWEEHIPQITVLSPPLPGTCDLGRCSGLPADSELEKGGLGEGNFLSWGAWPGPSPSGIWVQSWVWARFSGGRAGSGMVHQSQASQPQGERAVGRWMETRTGLKM